jgi:hypothetical protein
VEGNASMKMEIRVPREPSGEIRIAEELEAYKDALNSRIQEALDKYSIILLDRLADLTPIGETGETASSWEVFSSTWQIFITNSNEPVATFLSEGTVGHWIEPVTAQALHWTIGGIDFFSKGHMVTGITPHFIEWNALQDTQDDLIALLDEAESEAFDDAFERGANVQAPQTGDAGGDLGGSESDEGGIEEGGEGGD